jgi:hypothetical protein
MGEGGAGEAGARPERRKRAARRLLPPRRPIRALLSSPTARLPIRLVIPMSVDFSLLDHFEASCRREAARRALPEHWRRDPRPEAQIINEHWVNVIAQASERRERSALADAGRAVSVDDR